MDCTAQFLGYGQTGVFSKIVTDYVDSNENLQPFYAYPVNLQGLKDSISAREKFSTDRKTLVSVLRQQYAALPAAEAVNRNLDLLEKSTTFTITTAHQPNIFTGHLYFIYKILHTIRLAEYARSAFPEYHFVPVYFMGSEDADLEELGHIYVDGETLTWNTKQTGAVGRMSPKGIDVLIRRLEGQFGHLPHGAEMIALCKDAYEQHASIQDATLYLVHRLFASYGLIVLIPDNAALKRVFAPVLRKELTEQFSHKAVSSTITELEKHYKVQAAGRDINLFYLLGDQRNRIIKDGSGCKVHETDIEFTQEQILKELDEHPERFSPNVILRGVFQEQILPNIAFIGGGGELAYWLELKEVFAAAGVPYPLLVLRNSFMLVKEEYAHKAASLGIPLPGWFGSEQDLLNQLVRQSSSHQLSLSNELGQMDQLYAHLSEKAVKIDVTLQQHIAALRASAIQGLEVLEKKLLKAEKRKFGDQKRQIAVIKQALFPKGNLQERVENFMPYYAAYGKDILDLLYRCSKALDQEFGIIVLG
jgi:bacillithiol biosynthesis cysteine-adding enzyme BshC